MNASKATHDELSPAPISYVMAVCFGLPASMIILVTVCGNLLVLCFKARMGKQQTTLLIWNLGLADFLVGVLVLPFGAAYVVLGRWPFGRFLCKIWTACDVVFCTASIVTLCAIAVDRFIGVTRPLRYKQIVTKRRVVWANCIIWLVSFGILLTTVHYGYHHGSGNDTSVCSVAHEIEYVIHSVITAFLLPAAITLLLYWKIYAIARQRETGLRHGLLLAMGSNFILSPCLEEPFRIHFGPDAITRQQRIIMTQKRVAKTLGVVVGAFLICWLPFFTLYLVDHGCNCIPHIALDILTWLGYCNSMINPIIYAFTIEEFHFLVASHICCCFLSRNQVHKSSITTSAGGPFARTPEQAQFRRSKRAYSLVTTDSVATTPLQYSSTVMISANRLTASTRQQLRRLQRTNTVQVWEQNKDRRNTVLVLTRKFSQPIQSIQRTSLTATTASDELLLTPPPATWSAKAYTTLVNPHVTRL